MVPPFHNPVKCHAGRWLFHSAVFWLGIAVLSGLSMAVFLYNPLVQDLIPDYLKALLNFGRLRPMHVNLAVFGWLSMAYGASMLYLVPRLTGTPLYSEKMARLTVWLWNLLMVLVVVTFPLGLTQAREYAEMIWPLDILFMIILVLLAVNVWGTVWKRKEKRVYITVWNSMLAVLLGPMVYAIGNKVWDLTGSYTGMSDNIVNFFYVHNIFNVWFTTGGIGLALYLIPRLTDNPLWSHKLAFWGLLTVWTGQHHQLYSPAPDWLEILTVAFSVLAIIPNAAFFLNFWKTIEGRWSRVLEDIPLRFLVTFVFFYMLTCLQGVAHSFRTFSAYIHFTNWVVGHSHLAFVAGYSFLMFAMIYHLLPWLTGNRIYSARLMAWHYWLTLTGISIFMLSLWTAGLIQGHDWSIGGIPFSDTMHALRPYMAARLFGGATAVVAQLLFLYNVWKTAVGGAGRHPAEEASP